MSAETCPHCGASMLGDPISPKALASGIDPVPTVFETREEKLERLVEVVLEQGQLHASWLAAELLASREAGQ